MDLLTLVHVAISLAGIASGGIVIYGMITGWNSAAWTAFFLATTILTSASGYFLPADRILPSHVIGAISLAVLAAVYALYGRGAVGAWGPVYVVCAIVAQYFNVFVLIVQSFLKTSFLKALAPTQTEAPFAAAHLLALAAFIALGVFALRGFKSPAPPPAAA